MTTPDDSSPPGGLMRCTQCKGLLQASGQEPHRVICGKCGQNYFVTLQIVPVEPAHRPLLQASEGKSAE